MLKPAPSQDTTLFQLKGAGIERSGRWIVRDIDLSLERGEIVTLIGPNGSGKTTTAKMALGVIRPDKGSAWRKPGMTVSYVPQTLSIDETLPLSVERFMHLTGCMPVDERDRALDMTGTRHLLKADLKSLSGGERQRVSMARAIARKPVLLVLDEPVQGVDFMGEIALYELIGQIRDELNCGILLISHDLHIVMAATDHVVCLNGHICCSGTPSAVATSASYQELFGKRAPSALAVYEHSHDHTHGLDGCVDEEFGGASDQAADQGDRHVR